MTTPTTIQKFLHLLQSSLDQDSFVGLRLSGATKGATPVVSVDVRLITLKGSPHLSLDLHEPNRDVTQNLPLPKAIEWIRQPLGTQFRNALLRTTQRDWQLHCPKNAHAKLVSHRPTASVTPPRQHDSPKRTLLSSTANDWLCALGVTHTNGRPKVSMADKHRQISRFVEILHHLARDCGWTGEAQNAAILKVADMGCGKGYLTFAAWQLFHRTLRRPVSVLGVETRPGLVREANHMAHQIHADGLEFVPGNICSVRLPPLHVLIALHACNTATDDAIRRGIRLGTKLIVVAPCCHQALRPELGYPDPFAPLLRHGLLKERMAEWLTDGLRTLFLEWAGYQTKVIEFVGSEHTPKNLMITAVLKRQPFTDTAAKNRILDLKRFFGITNHALDELVA